MTASRAKRLLNGTLVYAGIIAATLLLVDGVCIAFGLFPPIHNYGDPDLGWRPARPGKRMQTGSCLDFMTREQVSYTRNEDGIRTRMSRDQVLTESGGLRIAVSGDSHTDLCATNERTHPGVLESELVSQGMPATVLAYGAGKYSPLQEYLAFRKVLRPYRPRVLVLNIYTGNDFNDILRVDDRPHFVKADSAYQIAPPVWFQYDDPALPRRSRVLFAARILADKFGVRQLILRVSFLRRLAGNNGGGLWEVFGYMRDLLKGRESTVGYPDAFTAQMLNQQLFFHRFPSSQDESVRRVHALMTMIRSENPGLLLVMSPLPSYQLTGEQPVDSALVRTLERLPITYEAGVRQEKALYEQLRTLAGELGWVFVDNLAALQAYHGGQRLYNNFDYHLLPTASAIIGRVEATALLDTLRRGSR